MTAILETSRRFHVNGLMSYGKWRDFERSCRPLPAPMTPDEIRELVGKSELDYFTFARLLNTTPRLVLRWQQGLARPRGPELKLLHLIRERGLDGIS
ncbi:helix-turn-helix domain-containing protein [Roseateles chitinivorans]|uniref:helix-turn-helix domain-containing protein n=1 Tax=Roseateles chitinivorans TaxID=2917965 RepID=UPI003D673B5A